MSHGFIFSKPRKIHLPAPRNSNEVTEKADIFVASVLCLGLKKDAIAPVEPRNPRLQAACPSLDMNRNFTYSLALSLLQGIQQSISQIMSNNSLVDAEPWSLLCPPIFGN